MDDLRRPDTRWVICSQFVGADSRSGNIFAVNIDPEAQDSCNVRIITAERSQGNGPLDTWPCVALTPRQLYMTPRYPLTPVMLPAMQSHTLESNETHPDTLDCKIRGVRPNIT